MKVLVNGGINLYVLDGLWVEAYTYAIEGNGLEQIEIKPVTDYTLRLISYDEGVAVSLEEEYILWQR